MHTHPCGQTMIKITFLGAAGCVTGSKTLLQFGKTKLLIDCGLFQGFKHLRELNWAPPEFAPRSLSAVVLTHAHIDHSGYVPVMTSRGFKGDVYCTPGTEALCRILWPDAAHLQEEDARYANAKGTSRHAPALPLFDARDAQKALTRLRDVAPGKSFVVGSGLDKVTCTFIPNGHLLGSAMVLVEAGGARLVFSGDVGRPGDLMMRGPEKLPECDYLFLESTYGNRLHSNTDVAEELAMVISETALAKGAVLMPTFAVGRAQALLHLIMELKAQHQIPDIPVFLDSPMAREATEAYVKFSREHRLTKAQLRAITEGTHIIGNQAESMNLAKLRGPHIILSASGMATGGRVLHHLARMAPNAKNTILFAGYQAGGTRGAKLLAGEAWVRIHGEDVPVKARVEQIDGLSSHADWQEMCAWLKASKVSAPQQVFVNHGDPEAADAMRLHLKDTLGWDASVPMMGQRIDIS